MPYNQTYEASDFGNILVDILGTGGVAILQYIVIIVVIFVVGWAIKKMRRR